MSEFIVRRKRAGTAFLAGAIILAGAAALIAAQAVAGAARVVPVVAARGEIPAFARLSESQLQVAHVPAGAVPPDALRAVGDAVGRFTRALLLPGEVVRAGHLAPPGAASSPLGLQLAERGDASVRALALPVGAAQGGTLPRPGDEVDVVAVLRQGQQGAALTMLQGVQVLDVRGGDSPVLVLLVTPQQAQDILAAGAAGSVSVTVRPKGAEGAKVRPTLPQDLLSRYGGWVAPAPQPPEGTPPPGGEASPR